MSANDNVEQLFLGGDMRLDNFYDALAHFVYTRAGEQGLTVMAVIGMLEQLKYELLSQESP